MAPFAQKNEGQDKKRPLLLFLSLGRRRDFADLEREREREKRERDEFQRGERDHKYSAPLKGHLFPALLVLNFNSFKVKIIILTIYLNSV